jgi:hypothetical protein
VAGRIGAAQIGGFTAAQHLHTLGGTPSAGHLWHESAAWNVAVGAGFAWIAARRSRPTGIVPTLTAFVAALGLLTVNDLIDGRVDVARVLSHSIIVAGYAIILVMSRPGADPGEPPAGRQDTPHRWRAAFDAEPEPRPVPRLRLRLVHGHPGQAWVGGLKGQPDRRSLPISPMATTRSSRARATRERIVPTGQSHTWAASA